MLHDNLDINEQGHLTVAGQDTLALAAQYGTPLYLLDEEKLRRNCRTQLQAMRAAFGADALPLYASKALCYTGIYHTIEQEGLGADVVSAGELYTAVKAGFPLDKVYFHGNNKTPDEIAYALEQGVGCFIVDNHDELDCINELARARGVRQKVLLRLTPGIDTHTFKAVRTGQVDSKFGVAIETGQALEFVRHALALEQLDVAGMHCHIGSQVFDQTPFCDGADIMIRFLAELRDTLGYTARELNLGGGLGVRYTEADPVLDCAAVIHLIGGHVRSACAQYGLAVPRILMEPGRSIVADCGVTLYTVGSVKEIPGYKNYVAIDGGMGDDPRYALYQSQYTVVNASRADQAADYVCTVAGRCCESGDLIAEDTRIQRPTRGDILAVLVTGAYNYSMASNYNRIPRPPIVTLCGGKSAVAVRRETLADMAALDM